MKIQNEKQAGFNWSALFFGPFWYITHGLIAKGIFLILITIATIGFGLPVIWIYCGIRANSDYFENQLKRHSQFSPRTIDE